MSTKRSHILKQTCTWKLQVCLSMCDLLAGIRHQRVKERNISKTSAMLFLCLFLLLTKIWSKHFSAKGVKWKCQNGHGKNSTIFQQYLGQCSLVKQTDFSHAQKMKFSIEYLLRIGKLFVQCRLLTRKSWKVSSCHLPGQSQQKKH